MPATLTVNRNAPDDAQQRQIMISLDGEPIAELMFGDSVTREISAGPHTLLADNTHAWELRVDGSWRRLRPKKSQRKQTAQARLMQRRRRMRRAANPDRRG